MAQHVPIETCLGKLRGRDCIFLDKVTFGDGLLTLVLEGQINGNLCTLKQTGSFVPYLLRFKGVLALKIIELDSWDYKAVSSFDEVVDSDWIQALGGKITSQHRHFFVQTYDDVFDIVCENFEFTVQN